MRRKWLLFGLSALLAFLITNLTLPCAHAGSRYKVLHAFSGSSDGGGVFAGVALDNKGNLYGTTSGGGAYGSGTVFELAIGAGVKYSKRILYSFCARPHCTDGELPMEGVVLGRAGNLYGTAGGGDNNYGVTFELTSDPYSALGWVYQVVYNTGSEGLLMDRAGNLYGEWGPGKYEGLDVFELEHGTDGWTEKVLYNFCPHRPQCRDGLLPQYGLTWDASGNLYGVTTEGGVNRGGVAFELEHTATGWKEHVLHSFPASPSDGYPPSAGLVVDRSGNVYGTTFQGGNGDNNGTVFELLRQPDGHWKETILYDFHNADQDGGSPRGGLVFDKAGNLYGTTTAGGDANCLCGVVFKMTPGVDGKWTYQVLHRFTGSDGYDPEAGVVLDDKGNLYGTTTEGGSGGYGVVYEITP